MSRKNHKGILAAMVLLSAAAIAAIMIILLWLRTEDRFSAAGGLDANARPADVKETQPAPDDILAQLQKEAEDSSFRFKINTAPRFDSPEAEGDWCIINSPENTFHMQVVVKDASGRELYRSQELKPGGQEMTGALESPLEAGEYPATATAYAIDPETGETAGSVETDLAITVGAG